MFVVLSDELALYLDGGRAKMRYEGVCRMCLRPHAGRPGSPRWLTRHHLVPKAWCDDHGIAFRIRDAEANIIPLCGSCHRDVETDEAARGLLRKVLTQTEIAFAIQLAGKSWFDDRYPDARSRISEALAAAAERRVHDRAWANTDYQLDNVRASA
jgi:hypothetical protein